MATRRGSRRGSDAEVDAVKSSRDTCPGLQERRGRRCQCLLLLGVEVMAMLAMVVLDEARRKAQIFKRKAG